MATKKNVLERLEAANQEINPRYDATFNDIDFIYKTFKGDAFSLICISFQYGYLQGSKATKKELEKAKS